MLLISCIVIFSNIKSNPMYNFIQKSVKVEISGIFLYAFF